MLDAFAPEIGFMQHGGPVYQGRPYVVGEAGPELFVPRTSGQIVPGAKGRAAAQTTVIVNMPVTTMDALSFRAYAHQNKRAIAAAVRAAMDENDPLRRR